MPAGGDGRTRTIRWQDPSPTLAAARTKTGIELLRAMATGELPFPPFADLIGQRFVAIEPSRVVFEFDPAEYMYSPLGTVHGGLLTVLLDSAMGCAYHTTLPAGISYTTLELKVNFVRPVTQRSGPVQAEGRVIHPGRTVATTEARLTDHAGTLYAHSTSTLLSFRAKGGAETE
jgi:uncharacterized protein (TIGR00369 family)